MKGFQLSKEVQKKKRLSVALGGHPKAGKTHFALTAPGPIAYFNLDMGEGHILGKFQKKKQIYVAEFKRSVLGIKADYKAMWKRFMECHVEAVGSRDVRSIVWDTGTEAWEIARLAHFGKLDKVMKHNYTGVNAEMLEMIRTVEESDKNFIVLMQMRKEYKGESETGNYEVAGYGKTGYLLDVNATAYHNPADGFWIEVENNRINMELSGEMLEAPYNDFANLAAQSFGTKPKEWY